MRVLIVDDAVVFRSQIKASLEGVEGITVVGSAANGKIALDRLDQLACDAIILDMEMPEMNGIEFLKEMKGRGHKQKVIVFASPGAQGARQAFEAIQAGAADFVPKPQGAGSLELTLEGIKRELVPKVMQFAKSKHQMVKALHPEIQKGDLSYVAANEATKTKFRRINLRSMKPRMVIIGSSTGGPRALEQVLGRLKDRRPLVPILIAQHMPPHFTACLANQLHQVCGIPAAEGVQGEAIVPGRIYIAPGDYHMNVNRVLNGQPIIQLDQGPKRNSVRPAVDSLFESAARHYGDAVAAFILTGMGEDGKIGCQAVKEAGGGVMIQDAESSVVWGMPGAVHSIGAFDIMGDLNECAEVLEIMVT